MIRLAIIAATVLAVHIWHPAYGEGQNDAWYTSHRSHSIIVGVDHEGCIAEIHVHNRPTDNILTLTGHLSLGDVTVGIAYEMNVDEAGAERYELFPPDGYVAIPQELTVRDNENGVAIICEWVGF